MKIKPKANSSLLSIIKQYTIITLASLIVVTGTYFFKFPNNFTMGGMVGLAVILSQLVPFSPATINLAFSIILIMIGFIFLGNGFGVKTVYSSLLMSVGMWALDYIYPMTSTLTDNRLLELFFATILPGLGSAIIFNIDGSTGGTDIIAMIIKRKTRFNNIGRTLFCTDIIITLSSIFVFSLEIFLCSIIGLLFKSIIVDNVIENINRSKVFNIICNDPKPICDYIVEKLGRSATTIEGEGAYSGTHKYVIFTAMKSHQAIMLRQQIKNIEPNAFMLISNTSEIIGRGFHTGL